MADGDQTFVEVDGSKFDERRDQVSPVWERHFLATFDADDTTDQTLTIHPLNGIIQKVVVKVNDNTNAVTSQLEIKDSGDNIVFDTGELAENDTYTFNMSEPVNGSIDFVAGISAAAGASGATIEIWVRGV
jgi:hypothetical protein